MEREVVAELLLDISKIKVTEISPKWFADRNLQYIVEDVISTDGNDEDLIMMAERIKERHSDSVVDKELLFSLANEAISNSRLATHAKELKIRYHERELSQYSNVYASNPTASNFKRLKDAMITVDEVKNSEEDTGDIRLATEQLYDEMENGSPSGVHTFQSVDMILGDGMAGGMLITIGARPAVGKTTFGVNLAIEALKKEDGMTLDFYSLEMTKKQMLKKFVSRLTEINSYKFVNTKLQLSQQEKRSVIEQSKWLEQKRIGLIDTCFDIDSLVRSIRRRAYSAEGKYIAFIDYLQLINGDARMQRYLQIGEVTRKLKLLSNELDIPIVVFSQISRGVEGRQDKTPTLADLRESGDIEQDSNVVAFLSNHEEDEGIVKLVFAKNRDGKLATVPFRMYKSKSMFVEDI